MSMIIGLNNVQVSTFLHLEVQMCAHVMKQQCHLKSLEHLGAN